MAEHDRAGADEAEHHAAERDRAGAERPGRDGPGQSGGYDLVLRAARAITPTGESGV